MSDRGALPEALRRGLELDHRAVRPLRPAVARAAAVILWTLLLLGVLPMVFGMRGDAQTLGVALSWGAALLESLVGLGLVALALREAVPAAGAPVGARLLALIGGFVTQFLVAAACWVQSGTPQGSFPPSGTSCFPTEGALALPALGLTVLLVVRAYTVRPLWAGVLAGTGAGLLTDGAWHLVCPRADLAHVLVLHGGAVAALAAVGWLAGYALETVRRRASRHRQGALSSP